MTGRPSCQFLIDQSIKNVSSTPDKFIVLGDFNTNFLSNPSPQLLHVINFNNFSNINDKQCVVFDCCNVCCVDVLFFSNMLF